MYYSEQVLVVLRAEWPSSATMASEECKTSAGKQQGDEHADKGERAARREDTVLAALPPELGRSIGGGCGNLLSC